MIQYKITKDNLHKYKDDICKVNDNITVENCADCEITISENAECPYWGIVIAPHQEIELLTNALII